MSSPLRTRSSNEMDPYSASSIYYGSQRNDKRHFRARTYSTNETSASVTALNRLGLKMPVRRGSHDEESINKQFDVDIDTMLEQLHTQEDTDRNWQITIEDSGPKVIALGSAKSNGLNKFDVRGTYAISSLLQELYLAKEHGKTRVVIDYDRLTQNAPDKLKRLIIFEFWDNLTRRIDGSVIEIAGRDPKDWTEDPRPRIYIPRGAPEQFTYYTQVAKDRPEIRLDVCWLPEKITPESVQAMNDKPGLLAVAMQEVTDPETGLTTLKGLPFVVPGGRFNELYGWDSYMESLGLIHSNRVELAKSMVIHFCFCIKHYGKILNANRSYYLCRSQPPFLTDMAIKVYNKIAHEPGALDFLRMALLAAIKEYHSVWMAEPRLDTVTGLSRYRPEGKGVPPETEATHFTHLLEPYAKKRGMCFKDFVGAYNDGKISEPELDDYFMHDRAVRESGHDTSYRLEKVCADLATIDLNSLLYKYEKDLSSSIRTHFGDSFKIPAEFCVGNMKPGHIETSALWDRRAKARKTAMDKYMWNEGKGMYFDYNTKEQKQCTYESCTTLWSLWSGLATPAQAASLVKNAIQLLEVAGGLVSGTEKSRGEIGLHRPNRQWDYPYGWAPQQMLAWSGLERYGYYEDAQRLAYKWLFMMTKAFVDFNGVVVEKYDVTRLVDPHRVDAEYGNQGLDFKGVAKEGFGWVNASYIYGLTKITLHMKRALGTLTPWKDFERATQTQTIFESSTTPEEDEIKDPIVED